MILPHLPETGQSVFWERDRFKWCIRADLEGGSRLMLIRLEGRHKLCLTAAESIEQKVRGSPGGQRSCLLVWPLTSLSSDSRPHTEGLNKQKWPISTVVAGLRFKDKKSLMIICFFSSFCLFYFLSVLSHLFYFLLLCHSLILTHTLSDHTWSI